MNEQEQIAAFRLWRCTSCARLFAPTSKTCPYCDVKPLRRSIVKGNCIYRYEK